MSDKTFGVRAGMVQFDPKRDRQVNGQQVTDVTIKLIGADTLVQVTIWPEFGQLKDIVKKGDLLAVDGALESRVYQAQDGSQQQAFQINATAIAHIPAYVKPPRQVVQAAAPVAAAPAVVPVAAPVAAPVATPVAAPVAAPTTAGAPF